MQLKKWALFLAPIFLLLSSFKQVRDHDFVILQGLVVHGHTGKPVNEAHVFIVEGEEETLTNSKGEFRIKTWQKLPLKLTVIDYINQEQVKINVSDPSKKQLITLNASK